MKEVEKVLTALKCCCLTYPPKCDECPHKDDRNVSYCPEEMVLDVTTIISEQQTKIEAKDKYIAYLLGRLKKSNVTYRPNNFYLGEKE